jgi:hypothetical protein
MLNLTTQISLRQATGEELLMLAIFGSEDLKPQIDNELDRRAMTGVAGGRGVVPNPVAMFSGYAA